MGDLDISGDRIINREGKILQSDYSRHSDSNGKNRKNRRAGAFYWGSVSSVKERPQGRIELPLLENTPAVDGFVRLSYASVHLNREDNWGDARKQ